MDILVKRDVFLPDTTFSRISLEGVPQCYGLEDGVRTKKIYAETCIPFGRYKIGVRTVGRFHSTYAMRYGSKHKGMLWVLDVPNFEYILIHAGNTNADTAGCLLVGTERDVANERILNSRAAYWALYEKTIEAALDGDLWIEYKDERHA